MTVELVKLPFDICLNQGRLVGQIRTGGGCMRVGEKLGHWVSALKKGDWAGIPLPTMSIIKGKT